MTRAYRRTQRSVRTKGLEPRERPRRQLGPSAGAPALLLVTVASSAGAAPPETNQSSASEIVSTRCASCHRFEGEPRSKFTLEGPDLMWAGQKYQRTWLLRFLRGQEPSPYPIAYRWDRSGPRPEHPRLDAETAEVVADWLEANARSPLVKEDQLDPRSLTAAEVRMGAELFEDKCIACHQIPGEEGPVGGPSSTHFLDAGLRYDPDWLHAFNQKPPAFTPHSGEYEPDVTPRQVRWVTGYLMTLGVEDVEHAKPWAGELFRTAEAVRGEEVFQTYCAQCHGPKGEGDGPAARGLEPNPAKLARMDLNAMDLQYLYEIVYFGGTAVGKSHLMPDWGTTLSERQIADVIAYLQGTFTGAEEDGGGACPQPRSTESAPPESLALDNPLRPTPEHLAAARALYHRTAKPLACAQCHGEKGDGLGPLAAAYEPPPRNFTCAETMDTISDGQLFWIIRNGASAGMPAYGAPSDEEVWQLVLLLREFAETGSGD